MLVRLSAFWLVMFAAGILPALFSEFGVPVHPEGPSRVYVIFYIAGLNAIFSALLTIAYFFGAKLSGLPTVLVSVTGGLVLAVLLRLLSSAMLSVQVVPTTVNVVVLVGGLVAAFLVPFVASFGVSARSEA